MWNAQHAQPGTIVGTPAALSDLNEGPYRKRTASQVGTCLLCLQGKLLMSDSFPGQDRSKLCLASKVTHACSR